MTTTFKTTGQSGNYLELGSNPVLIDDKTEMQPGIAVLGPNGSGSYVTLTDHDRRELAFKLLEDLFDVHYHYDTGLSINKQITLTPKKPRAKVGQFYRVISTPGMAEEWQGNPIARVKEVYDVSSDVVVELKDGNTSLWDYRLAELVGPLDVVEVVVETEWRERNSDDA